MWAGLLGWQDEVLVGLPSLGSVSSNKLGDRRTKKVGTLGIGGGRGVVSAQMPDSCTVHFVVGREGVCLE